MITIDFGLELEGGSQSTAAWGEVSGGPQVLLSLLELRLGLAHRPVSDPCRAAAYRVFLEQVAGMSEVFFKNSLELDPVGVSRELLEWRDELVLSGWDPQVKTGCPRIEALAAVELAAAGKLSLGVGDRLLRILAELKIRNPGIGFLTVREPKALFPALWTRTLEHLGARFGSANPIRESAGAPIRDLDRLAAALAGAGAGGAKDLLQGDNSLQIWEAFSEIILARTVAQEIGKALTKGWSVAVVAPDGGRILADALRAEALPAPRTRPFSQAFPIPQLLGLCLNLLWEPLDPQALIDFLTHAVSPIPSGLRRRLASAVAKCPGIAGPAWQKAFEDAEKSAAKRHGSDADALARELSRIQSAREQWIEQARYPESGADRSAVVSMCRRLASWAGSRATSGDKDLASHFAHLAGAASEVANIVEGPGTISRLELTRWTEQAVGYGRFAKPTPSDAGSVTLVQNPGAIQGRYDLVVWFGFDSAPESRRIPWNLAERKGLAVAGVILPDGTVRRERELLAWRTLVASAKQMLILARPRTRHGQPIRSHPLQSRLQALSARGLQVHEVEPSGSHVDGQKRGTELLQIRRLPTRRQWWNLGRPVAPRSSESFTSLSQFIYHPYQWLLRYSARLKPGPLSEMRINSTAQAGSILDRLCSDFFVGDSARWRNLPDVEIEQWLKSRWDPLLHEMALNLLQPGQRVAAESLRETARRVLVDLARLLSNANIESVEAQVQQQRITIEGVALTGIPDLICRRSSDGRVGILDLKLGGRETRERELTEARALQLAIYRQLFLASGPTAQSPATGFYLLSAQRLLSTHDFWGSSTVRGTTDNDATCWDDFLRVWRWRRDQLAAGWVEVVAPDVVETGGPVDPLSPVTTWSADKSDAHRDPYSNLIGWNSLA